jgi:hypothetical protein
LTAAADGSGPPPFARRWIERARRGLGDNYARLLSGTIGGQAAILLGTPLISRLYAPREVGAFMVLMACAGVSSYAMSWRLELALVAERDEPSARSLLALCLALVVPMAVLAALACVGLAHVGALNLGALAPHTALVVAPILVVTGLFTVLRYWQVRESRFAPIARALWTQGTARALTPLAAAVWRADWLGLCASEIVGRLVGIYALSRGVWALLRGACDLSRWRRLLAHYWKFPLLLLPSALLDALAQNVAVPAIAGAFGTEPAGQFALASRIGTTAVTLLAASAGDVLHARLAQLAGAERVALIWREARRVGVLGLLLFVPGAIAAPWLAEPVLGRGWHDVGWMFALTTPAFLAMVTVSPLSRVFVVTRHIELKLLADCVCVALPVSALLAASGRGLKVALGAFVLATLIAYAVYFLLILRSARSGARAGITAA